MRDEAKIEETEVGRVPADDGWYILNLSEIRWATVPGGGTWCGFGSPNHPSEQIGIGVHILWPGDAPGYYHEEDDLEGFRPVALCLNDDSGSALVVYHARLRSGAEPVPDETKVAELHWAASPSEIGAQVSVDTVACWAALERWRDSLGEGAAA